MTQKSLRQAIGVVPQDSVLFNSSISYNIGYTIPLHDLTETAFPTPDSREASCTDTEPLGPIHAPTPITPSSPFNAEPLTFLTTNEPSTQLQPECITTPTQVPAVTFDANVNTPPSRTETPDLDNESKPKHMSTQNFQQLAQRISLTTQCQSSSPSIIPGLRCDSPRVSTDDSSP